MKNNIRLSGTLILFLALSNTVSFAAHEDNLIENLKKKYGAEVSETTETRPSVNIIETVESRNESDRILKDAENYLEGKNGFSKDIEKAKELYLKAAEAGNPEAQYEIGRFHYNGENGFLKDEVLGIQWCQKAAEKGHAQAQVNLVVAYAQGSGGLKKSRKMARHWHDQILQSDKTGAALTRLGMLYILGNNIAKFKKEEILEVFTIAAERGDATAQVNFAEMHEPGFLGFFPTDRLKAIKWYKKAARQGNEIAIKRLKKNYGITNFDDNSPESQPETISCPETRYKLLKNADGLESGMIAGIDDVTIFNGSAHCTYDEGNEIKIAWINYKDPLGPTAKSDCSTKDIYSPDEVKIHIDDKNKSILFYSQKALATIELSLSKKEFIKENQQQWIDLAKQLLPSAEKRGTDCTQWQKGNFLSEKKSSAIPLNSNTHEESTEPKNRGPRAIME